MKSQDQPRGEPGTGEEKQNGSRVSDDELMARFKKGDADAFEILMKRHGPVLFGFLVRMTGNPQDAQDIFQEVFLKVIKAADHYRPGNFPAWLFTIARNELITRGRRKRVRAEVPFESRKPDEERGLSVTETAADPNPDPEESAAASERELMLEQALEALPPEQREVLLLRTKAELSFKQIAKITRTPLNTVKTRMHYALENLRRAFKEQGLLEEE